MNKRKIISLVLVISVLLSSFISINADNTSSNSQVINSIAKTMNKLGMLSGDNNGNFNLSSKLLRLEGATFIVNMLGMNDFVKQNKQTLSNTEFVDIKNTEWYAANIGFCAQYKIVGGYTQNGKLYCGPTEFLTEKQFIAMLLRALGYTDVSWNDTFRKAYNIGLVKDESYQNREADETLFTRGDTVKLMYNALLLSKNGSQTPLIKELVNSGKISQEIAVESGIIVDNMITAISNIVSQGDEWIEITLNENVQPVFEKDITIYNAQTRELLGFSSYSQGNSTIRLKTSKQSANSEYIVEIKEITDYEGNKVRNISGKFEGFHNKEIVSDLFKISKIEQTSSNEAVIYFTHPINDNAKVPEYFDVLIGTDMFIKGGKASIDVNIIGERQNAVKIALKSQFFTIDKEYTIKVSGSLLSAYGTYLGQEAGDEHSFIAKEFKEEKFKVIGLNSITSKTIQLDFNKELDITSEQIFNYYITELNSKTPVQIIKASIVNGKSVVLSLANPMDNKKAYNLMVNIAYDSGRQNKIENVNYTFNGTDAGVSDIKVTSIVPLDTHSIYVTFDREISEDSATNVNNYSILCLNNTMYDVMPVKAVYSEENPKAVKLYVAYNKPLTASYIYRLRVGAAFQDKTGVALSKALEYTFIANSVAKLKPEIIKAVYLSKDTVKVTFNKDISMDAPNILVQNYYIQNSNGDKKIPLGISYIDINTIVFKFDKLDVITQNYFIYKEIKDITGETYSGAQTVVPIVAGE